MSPKLLLLELNEVNFDIVRRYADAGQLPNFASLIRRHGMARTVSESRYEELEPWIQWVSAHTGLPFASHRVFRLGDIVGRDITQIWEWLENKGLTVGAVSPINAENRTRNSAFFLPDPWTDTRCSGAMLLQQLHRAARQAVNDNATSHLTPISAFWLVCAGARYARLINYPVYVELLRRARGRPWFRAMILDLLLSDLFVTQTASHRPAFASLFLNAAAHIQHHYLFNSMMYNGDRANPSWYVEPDADPILDVYRLYDRIVGQIRRRFESTRIIVATGLHQEPHSEGTYYWRLKDHAEFLRKIGVSFKAVEGRMSRDFVVLCEHNAGAKEADRILNSVAAADGRKLFMVDNRGDSLFVTLEWPNDIPQDFEFVVSGRRMRGLREDVAFVAIKNGQHNGIGYVIDTGNDSSQECTVFPLTDLPSRICAALGVEWRDDTSIARTPEVVGVGRLDEPCLTSARR